MRNLVFAIMALVFVSAPLAQGEGPLDETRITLRQEVLRLINTDRQAHGLTPVTLDIEASSVADAYCRNQIANGTTGHFSTDGYAPYMRYSLAGGNDGVSENAAAWSANYRFSDRAVYEMARRSDQAMMSERAPHDGHRRTILDPYATHVGLGVAWENGEFRLAEEFIRRYVSWPRPLPRSASLDEPVTGTGRAADGYRIEAISVHHEPIPEAMPARVANAITSYSLPEKRRDYLPRLHSRLDLREDGSVHLIHEEYTDGRRGDFNVAEDGSFTFTVPFHDGPGIYTVVVWVTRKGERTPVAASNISIRVDKPAYSYAGTR
ncbi:MAG TPA: CAP domain-containing protein [Thermoanaerobaculia bacterium]